MFSIRSLTTALQLLMRWPLTVCCPKAVNTFRSEKQWFSVISSLFQNNHRFMVWVQLMFRAQLYAIWSPLRLKVKERLFDVEWVVLVLIEYADADRRWWVLPIKFNESASGNMTWWLVFHWVHSCSSLQDIALWQRLISRISQSSALVEALTRFIITGLPTDWLITDSPASMFLLHEGRMQCRDS